MSEFLYNARASWIRCFWPPLKLIPRSPISVWSPKVHNSKSFFKAQAWITVSYHTRFIGAPNRILSSTLPLWIHADCATYAVVPLNRTCTQRLSLKIQVFFFQFYDFLGLGLYLLACIELDKDARCTLLTYPSRGSDWGWEYWNFY